MSLYIDIQKGMGEFRLNVQLEVGDDVMGVLGASGSGKSMTLRCVAGVVTPDSGEIVLNGRTLYSSAKKINLIPRRRNVGLMFQNYALFPNMTVAQNITVGVRDRQKRETLLRDYVQLLRLEGLEERYPAQLSGGQQQRVALARMMASSPDILLLDEPFSALDRHLRFSIEQEFADALARFRGTVLYVSHSIGEVYEYCSHTAVLMGGEVAELGETAALFQTPATVEAARLTGCKNISPVRRLEDGALYLESWGLRVETARPLPPNTTAVGVREADLALVGDEDDHAFPVRVGHVKQFPQFVVLSLYTPNCENPLNCSCPKHRAEQYQMQSDRGQLRVRLDASRLLFLCDKQQR